MRALVSAVLLLSAMAASAKPLKPFPLPEPFERNPDARHRLYEVQERRLLETRAEETLLVLRALSAPAPSRLAAEYGRVVAEQDASKLYASMRDWQAQADAFLDGSRLAWMGEEAALRKAPQAAAVAFYKAHQSLARYRKDRLAQQKMRLEALRQAMIPDGTPFSPTELGLKLPESELVRAGSVDDRPGLFIERGRGMRFESADGKFVMDRRKDAKTGAEVLDLFYRRADGKLAKEVIVAGREVSEIEYRYDAAGRLLDQVTRRRSGELR